MTSEEVIHEYGVSNEDIKAALMFASDLIEHEEYHPLPQK